MSNFSFRVGTYCLSAVVAASIAGMAACASPHPTTGTEMPAALTSAQIATLLASPDRSAADRAADLRRKPQPTLEFIGVRPGMVALDLSAGGGYTTELLARAAGPQGRVYGQSAPRDPARAPAAAPEGGGPMQPAVAASAPPPRGSAVVFAERAASLQGGHLIAVLQPFDAPVPAEAQGRLDLVTLMLNYHDLGHLGVDRDRMNAAVFAGLKPGGVYVIADNAGRPGTGISESGTLHRVEQRFLQAEVERTGFRLVAEGEFLRNPNDARDRNTPEPPQPKDAFILKFIRP